MREEAAFQVVSTRVDIEDTGYVTVYGVAYRSESGEEVRIDDISADRETVEHLVALLREGEASPLHVYDIVCDFVAEL